MASCWDQIASHCSVEGTLDNAQSLLKSSSNKSIPSSESASPNTVKALKYTDEAYKAIHAYLHDITPIEDLFRGKMTREQYRSQVECCGEGGQAANRGAPQDNKLFCQVILSSLPLTTATQEATQAGARTVLSLFALLSPV